MDKVLEDNFKLQAPKCKLNEEAIAQLEKSFNIKLPDDYKDFVLTYGAVVFEVGLPDSFIITFEDEKRIGDILNFLTFQEIFDAYNLLREETVYGEEPQIPKYMIPIAHINDSYYRHYILLNKQDNSIWTTEEDESIESNLDTYGKVADSFSEFLIKLDDSDNLEKSIKSKHNL